MEGEEEAGTAEQTRDVVMHEDTLGTDTDVDEENPDGQQSHSKGVAACEEPNQQLSTKSVSLGLQAEPNVIKNQGSES